MKKLFLFLISSLLVFCFDLMDLKKQIDFGAFKGKFLQEKSLAGFPQKILLEGEFKFQNEELFWHIQKPIGSMLKITKEGIFLQDLQGKWQKTTDQYDKGLFLDILHLDLQKLQKVFQMELQGGAKQWKLKLGPKNLLMQKIFKQITIQGGDKIKNVLIEESNGDKTLMQFKEVVILE